MNLPPNEVFQSCIRNNKAYLILLNQESLNYKNHYTIFNTDKEEYLGRDLDRRLGANSWVEFICLGPANGYSNEQEKLKKVLLDLEEETREYVPCFNGEGKRSLGTAPVQLPDIKRRFNYEEIKKRYVSRYKINVSWDYLETQLSSYLSHYNLDLDPDFQRAHVWTQEKQIDYVEFILSGGQTAKEIYFNCPGWQSNRDPGPMVLVDGKQRIQAVSLFLKDELEVFGGYKRSEILGLARGGADFIFYVNDLETRRECLEWYLQINEGGVAHTTEEIQKVKALLEQET